MRLFEGVRAYAGGDGTDGQAGGPAPRVALGLEVMVRAEDLPDPEPIGPLGGFRRMAAFERLDGPWQQAAEPEPPADGRYVAILISPARFADLSWHRPGGQVPGLPGRLVCACTDRPVMIGGWDGRQASRGPVALRAHLPAGSVFFLEAEPAEVAALFHDRAPRSLGLAANIGFGRFVLGLWPQQGS